MSNVEQLSLECCQRYREALQAHKSIASHPNFDSFIQSIGTKTAELKAGKEAYDREANEGWNHGSYQRNREVSKAVRKLAGALENMGPTELEHWTPPLETVAWIMESPEDDVSAILAQWVEVTLAVAEVIKMRQELPKPKHRIYAADSIRAPVYWLAKSWEEFFQKKPRGGDGAPFTTLVNIYYELSPWGDKAPSHATIRAALSEYQ